MRLLKKSAKKFFLPFLGAMALMGCGAEDPNVAGVSGKVTRTGTAEIGGAFSMIDETGTAVSDADLIGKPHLIYFGFTYCPDICPTSLQKLGAAQQLMGKAGDDVGFILITVDPERDTPEKLAEYVSFDAFPSGLRGFTGSVGQVRGAHAVYKVAVTKSSPEGGPVEDGSIDYTVDHSDIIYFMGADGEFADVFTARSTPQDIAVRVRQELMKKK